MIVNISKIDEHPNETLYCISYPWNRDNKYKLFIGKFTGFHYSYYDMILHFEEKQYSIGAFKTIFTDHDEAQAYLEYLNGA